MGIDTASLHAILKSFRYVKNRNKILTLGRQQIHIPINTVADICTEYKVANFNSNSTGMYSYCEKFFENALGCQQPVMSIDYSEYEKCMIVHDMNRSIRANPLMAGQKFDYIYDGGTIEHVFNLPQVLENVINLLEDDGIFCSVTCNNNFSGHGFYQFSPELFYRAFSADYGMCVEEMFLAQNHTHPTEWIKLEQPSKQIPRIENKFDSKLPVYIITIARKLSSAHKKKSLLDYPPYQYGYEENDWKAGTKA